MQYKEIYTQDFAFYSDNKLKVDALVTFGFLTGKAKGISQFNFNLSYSYLKSISGETSFSLGAGKIGFVF